ncbi:MAG: TIGR03088 family PEP-CTERM/XrtA system glycosyltransferase [Betaproteobacteria bacterium]
MTTDTRPLVLHVIHHLVTGGMENGLVNLINHLPESRFRHAIACIEDFSVFRQRLKRPDVEVIALHRSRVGVWRVRRELYRIFRRLRPALVHTRNMSALDALLPARLAGVPQRLHGEHGWDVNNLRGENRRLAILRRLHRPLIDRYVTVSKDLERYLIERVGVPPERVMHIYNGVDVQRFAPAGHKPVGLLPGWLAQPGTLVLGTVGRIQAVKDHATLVRAFAGLCQSSSELRSNVRLVIVGDGPLLEALRALASSLGVADLTWFVGRTDNVPAMLSAFDVFVLPSLAEGMSNTILEAMASGLPILATTVGGNIEIIEDGRTGRLFKPGDVGALVALLIEYSNNASLRRAHAKAAREVAVERFDLMTMVRKYQAIYETMCGEV